MGHPALRHPKSELFSRLPGLAEVTGRLRTFLDKPEIFFGGPISDSIFRKGNVLRGSARTETEPLMGQGSVENKNARSMIWVRDYGFQGWVCSQCGWSYTFPALLSDPDAKAAYDRLAAGKFRGHDCANNPGRPRSPEPDSFPVRLRNIVAQGFKPKDAVDLFLQEIKFEYPDAPKILEQARTDAEDFLRHIREGLV